MLTACVGLSNQSIKHATLSTRQKVRKAKVGSMN